MDNKTRIIGIRVEQSVFTRLNRVEAETGMEKVSLARTALMAVLEDYERTGVLRLPLRITSSADAAATITNFRDVGKDFPNNKAAETPVKFTPGKKPPRS